MHRAAALVLVLVLTGGLLLSGCGGSSDANAFCAESASLTANGTQIQKLSPSDIAQVKAQVAALLPAAKRAEAKAPKAIRSEVKLLGDALDQFADAVASATTPQALITAFSAYGERGRDLAQQAQQVDAWVSAHCQLPARPAS